MSLWAFVTWNELRFLEIVGKGWLFCNVRSTWDLRTKGWNDLDVWPLQISRWNVRSNVVDGPSGRYSGHRGGYLLNDFGAVPVIVSSYSTGSHEVWLFLRSLASPTTWRAGSFPPTMTESFLMSRQELSRCWYWAYTACRTMSQSFLYRLPSLWYSEQHKTD